MRDEALHRLAGEIFGRTRGAGGEFLKVLVRLWGEIQNHSENLRRCGFGVNRNGCVSTR